MKKINIEVEEGSEALSRLRVEWQAMFRASGAPPFLSWEWLSTWHRWFGQERHPFLLCARESGNLVALLPLCAENRQSSRFSPRLNRMSFMGESYGASDYLDILALPGFKQKSADIFIDYLAAPRSFDLLELEGMAADSCTLQSLTRRFANDVRFMYRIVPQYICPRVSLDVRWEDLLERSRRSDYFKRCIRRLKKIASFEFRVISDVNEIPAAFGRLMTLHVGRWIDRGGSAAFRTVKQKGFTFDAAAELARAGMARFEEIWLEGECRASLLGFESGDCYYFFLSGFDQAWSKYSLGFTLLWLSIREASRRGLKMYDFLRGDENYKFDWSDNPRMTVTAQVASDSRVAKWHVAREHTKEIARALLPDWTKTRLRRLRQRPTHTPFSPTPVTTEIIKGSEWEITRAAAGQAIGS
ncbi:MAG TPA: GNAT family N-acetyltransferase [Blastocatellia bacterium]|nr:GNAT family N-acetyltransferase [Blastocatellia bacterium]